ncbi:MAG: cation diffusion facilitator family transporter [Hyphomonadaceae bacterium]|nr:cation diffusion facilitator family transporter [Clostridia bacterium]
MAIDKQKAALSSVFAAIFLTIMKIVVGIFTGSLGIMSEALHSALDLVAAVITYFAVKFSDKPADDMHHYGHGKIESFSALIETFLLLLTSGWIIYEAIEKLLFGKDAELMGIHWGILTMAISIIVDASRVKVLKKAAEEHGSQALEADALHFSSDIWSSSVVIVGLICVWLGETFNIPLLKLADPIAALGVALLVIKVSIKLGKRTIDVLLDTAPKGLSEVIATEISQMDSVLEVAEIRIRPSGAIQFIYINVGIEPHQSHKAVHAIAHCIKEKISQKVPRSDVVVSTYPVEVVGILDESINHVVECVVKKFPNCANIHNIHIYEIGEKKKITAHIQLTEDLSLKDAHALSHEIGACIACKMNDVDDVSIHFEPIEHHTDGIDVIDKTV